MFLCYLFLFCSFIIRRFCLNAFSFISRAEVVSSSSREDANIRTYIYFFRYSPLLLRHYLRPSYNCVNLRQSAALLAFLFARSVTSCSTLIDSGCPFSLCCAALIFLCPFLLLKLIFRLFDFLADHQHRCQFILSFPFFYLSVCVK